MSWNHTALTLTLALAIGPGGAAPAATRPGPPEVPAGIEPPAGSSLVLVGHAVGTQNFICAPAATPTSVDWVFIGPQATLFNRGDQQTLTHFVSRNPFRDDALQATWQHSRDTSTVWAARIAGSSDPSYVAPDAIEWLLLEMTGAQVGPTAGRTLATIRYIQRVHTVGGVKPPADECTVATINTRRFVPYEADYYFYQ